MGESSMSQYFKFIVARTQTQPLVHLAGHLAGWEIKLKFQFGRNLGALLAYH